MPHDERPQTQSFMDRLQPKKLLKGLKGAVQGKCSAGILGALGEIASFVCTTTIIPFMPNGWAASTAGFPAMTERVAFLMKDFALLAVSIYLLKQDLLRLSIGQSLSSAVSGPPELSGSPKTLKRTA